MKISNKHIEVNVNKNGEFEVLEATGKNRFKWDFYQGIRNFIYDILEGQRFQGRTRKGFDANDMRDIKNYVRKRTKEYLKQNLLLLNLQRAI